jgi:hypothetical protein
VTADNLWQEKSWGNREIRGIREPQSAFGVTVWIFRVFGVFRGSKNSFGADLGTKEPVDIIWLNC